MTDTMSWPIFDGTKKQFWENRDAFEWTKTSATKQIKKRKYRMYWSSRQGGIWVKA